MTRKYKGTGYEVGHLMGKSVKSTLEENIKIIKTISEKEYGIDLSQIKTNYSLWFDKLPEQYKDEVVGLSEGSGCSLELIMQWIFFDNFIGGGCTSFIVMKDGNAWVGRNNDYIAPKIWNHVSIIEKKGLIPVMLFGMGGDMFSGTGYNKERIWLHYNWLPVWDKPKEEAYPAYIFLRMALESCQNINDLEKLLEQIPRTGGMNLFFIDGKDNTFAVYECTCNGFVKRQSSGSYIVGANHYHATSIPGEWNEDFTDSRKRQKTVEDILEGMIKTRFGIEDIKKALASVEKENGLSGTVYANIACPALDKIFYACDDFPAVSKGQWEAVVW
jgi:predicted choloylglycine hydrolase